MAQTAKRATIAVYDGQVVISDIVKRKTTVPIFSSNETYSATLVTSWYDGSPMDDTKADGSDATTTQDLANAIKAYINANVVPLVNAIKASQNTELTNQRTAGQQAP